jgi:putative endonuclease
LIFTTNKELGAQGENLAVDFLKRRGFIILKKNYECPLGEIDIIAKEKEQIIFVEVKTRASLAYGMPFEAVDFKKRKKLLNLALYFLKKECVKDYTIRFDVVSVLFNSMKSKATIQLIRGAF